MTLATAHIHDIASFLSSILENLEAFQRKLGEPIFRDEEGRQVSHEAQATLLYKSHPNSFLGFPRISYANRLNLAFPDKAKAVEAVAKVEAGYLSEGIKVSSIIGIVLLEAGCDIRTKEGYLDFVKQWKEANQSVKSHLDKSARHAFYVLRHAARQFMVENRIT